MNNQSYKQTLIMTASPMELILMLYDEAIKSLSKAENAFKLEGPERIEEINNNLIHAQDVITELAVSIDVEKGGEIAENLHRLYDFMLNHLTKANASKIIMPIIDVRKLLSDLRETWKQVAENEPRRNSNIPISKTGTIAISG